MKVLLIDDEPLARIGIRSIIPWQENGFRLVGEARNGVEGLEMAEKYYPDLILVDIIMPEMDGIEFIRRVKKILPDCKLIIMSCMNDEKYFREAIHLGVSEYILKDRINPDEILETVCRVANEIRRERVIDDDCARVVNKNMVLTEFMNLVLQGQIRDSEKIAGKLDQRGFPHSGLCFYVACIRVCDSIKDHELSNEDGIIDYSVINICQEIITSSTAGYLFKAYDGELAAIIQHPGDDSMLFFNQLYRQLSETLEQCMDCRITMGISAAFDSCVSISEGYQQAFMAMECSFFKGTGKLFAYLQDCLFDKNVTFRAEALLKEALRVSSVGELHTISRITEDVSGLFSQGGISVTKAREIYSDIFSHVLFLLRKAELDTHELLSEKLVIFRHMNHFPTSMEIASSLCEIILLALTCNEEKGNMHGEHNLLKIQSYITEHIYEKISLDSVANHVYLSPAYVCRFFKKEIGTNLLSYILQMKLDKASELLLDHQVGEVADLLGFTSHSYFISVFKKEKGITPLQFQRKRKHGRLNGE